MVTTAPVFLRPRNFQWYWHSATRSSSSANEEQWQKYSDVTSEIIEDAFIMQKDQVEIDRNYVIDLKFMTQNNKLDTSNTLPVKRGQFETNENNSRVRQERFSLPIAISSISETNTSSQSDQEQEWKGTGHCGFNYQISELAKKNATIAHVIEEAAQGIIKAGEVLEKLQEAIWLAQQLLNVKAAGHDIRVIEYEQVEIPSVIGETCVYLYTKESFWYKALNQVMRDPANITREDVKTYGPFAFLLHNYLHQCGTGEISTVYRGVNLTDEQRLKLKNDVQFSSFTSTSKSRQLAEFYSANTLLIIDLNTRSRDGLEASRTGAYISHLSHFCEEEEFLIWPQTSFHYLRDVYDEKTKKYIIYLKSYQTNC